MKPSVAILTGLMLPAAAFFQSPASADRDAVFYFDGAAKPPASIFGIYGLVRAGHDSIQVTEKSSSRIGVNLRLYFSGGHTCQLTQDGDWRGDHVAVVAEGLDADRPCRLDLFFENGRIRLEDEGLHCAPVYCGTRGKLDGASLTKSSLNRK
jgi:hypothetical protein